MKPKGIDRTNRVYKYGQVFKWVFEDSATYYFFILRLDGDKLFYRTVGSEGEADSRLFPIGEESWMDIGSILERTMEGPLSEIIRELYGV